MGKNKSLIGWVYKIIEELGFVNIIYLIVGAAILFKSEVSSFYFIVGLIIFLFGASNIDLNFRFKDIHKELKKINKK